MVRQWEMNEDINRGNGRTHKHGWDKRTKDKGVTTIWMALENQLLVYANTLFSKTFSYERVSH